MRKSFRRILSLGPWGEGERKFQLNRYDGSKPERSRSQNNLARECAHFTNRVFFLQAVGGGSFRERHDSIDLRFQFSLFEPAVDVFGASARFVRRSHKHNEAV